MERLDRDSLIQLLAMAQAAGTICKRMSLHGWRIVLRGGSPGRKLLKLRELFAPGEWLPVVPAQGLIERYACVNCGAEFIVAGEDLLCSCCRVALLDLSAGELAHRIGSAAEDGKFWQSAVAAARRALGRSVSAAGALREIHSCLAEWTEASTAFASAQRNC